VTCMAEVKTKKTQKSVSAFLNTIEDEQKRKNCKTISKIMKDITGKQPAMWGERIVGFDTYHYKYASGREGDWFKIGFSPRKQAITIYIMPGYQDYSAILKKLGPHKTGKCCLYIKRLEDIDLSVLNQLLRQGYNDAPR